MRLGKCETMDRHRRTVIKSLIVTAWSIVIGKQALPIGFSGSCDGDGQFDKNLKKAAGPQLQIIEKTIDDLEERDRFVDLVTLSAELRLKGKLEKMGGIESLIAVCDRYNLYDQFT